MCELGANDATMLEQSEFVPGSCNIRYGASTEKLDEIGLMRMPCREVECDTYAGGVTVDAVRDRSSASPATYHNTEQQMMMDT